METKPTQTIGETQGGDAKERRKNEKRSRRALKEIGNLNPVQGIEIKVPPLRPLTRGFCARLEANARQAPAPSEHGCNREKKPQSETPLESTEQTGEDELVINGREPHPSYSEILCKRSVDIDAADRDNELAVVDYVDDMFRFYRQAECESKPTSYMVSQPELNPRIRAILVDWIVDAHVRFNLTPEALYLTVNILDRVLSSMVIRRGELQLVGVGAMLIASKYEEIYAPTVQKLVDISNEAFCEWQVLAMEKMILCSLSWTLTVPTAYMFLVRFVKASIADKATENMAHYLAELGLTSYEMMVGFPHSMFAAAAVYVARCTMGVVPAWTETLRRHSAYEEGELRECAVALTHVHATARRDGLLRSVVMKYSLVEGGVVNYPPIRLHLCG